MLETSDVYSKAMHNVAAAMPNEAAGKNSTPTVPFWDAFLDDQALTCDEASRQILTEPVAKNLNTDNIDEMIDVFANQIQLDPDKYTQKKNDHMFVIPTQKRTQRANLAPIVLLKARSINGQLCNRPFICLLDSGSTGCL